MVQPQVQPSDLYVQAAPGDSRDVIVSIASAPTTADVTASITGGDPRIVLKSVVATRYVWRDANPDEGPLLPKLPKLPGHPGGSGPVRILEPQEVGRTDGSVPLSVPAAASVQFLLTISAPADAGPDVVTASLVINGTGWDPTEVPITLIIGPADAIASVDPVSVRLAAEPGETVPQDVVVASAPAAAKVLVHMATTDSIMRLKYAVVFWRETRPPTQDELDHMPIGMRAQAIKDGIVQYREIGRSDGSTPLAVPQSARVQAYMEFSAPTEQVPDFHTNTLVFDSTAWQRVEVPLYLAIGKVSASVSPDSVSVRQGDSGTTTQLTLTSEAGPDTDVHLSFDQAGFGSIIPAVVNVARGTTSTFNLKLGIDPGAPTGVYPVGLDFKAFGQLQLRMLPFTVTVQSGDIMLTPLQTLLSAQQGDKATCQVVVVSLGGYKHVTFAAGTLPAGVTMTAPDWENYGAATTVLSLGFAVDPDAPAVDAGLASVNWDAGDGEHKGRLDLSLNVLLRPESRTFNGIVVTPSGTALGGEVQLTLNNDGTGRFTGEMRDSGTVSYKFSVRGVVRSVNGRTAVVVQKSGEVYGTFEPGPSKIDWDDSAPSDFLKSGWKDIRTGTLAVSKSYEISGVVGSLLDLLSDLLDFVVSLILLAPVPGGSALACLVFIGSELGSLYGVRVVGPGGLIGVVVASGAAFLVGPAMIIPAFVAGVLVGDLLIKHHALSDDAAALKLATAVFGDQLPADKIILTNLSGENDKKFTVPNMDGTILVNLGNAYDDPTNYKDQYYTMPGQVFIHELTHAWQITHAPFSNDVFWKAAQSKLDGSSAYYYGPPGPDWDRFGLEQQGSIVDDWYAGTIAHATSYIAGRTPASGMNKDDPYYGYISNNILLGEW